MPRRAVSGGLFLLVRCVGRLPPNTFPQLLSTPQVARTAAGMWPTTSTTSARTCRGGP